MAYKTTYELHHHFPRLAEESGFTFNTHRPRVHIDWNKIKLIDLDSLIRERKFVIIEQHLNDILDCVFESEFDVRILDEGVLKMFRLAQLAVEYQQFCRHYLDRSVYVIREEITSLAQELDATKKQLQDREEELRKIKRRTRHTYKTPLPYGNDNIAAMILKTLSNKGDIFPSSANTDALQHNKCSYCDKVFLNQLYLQSHIARRHADVMETPQKEKQSTEQNNENAKMSAEIMELRTKLKEMEQSIANTNKNSNTELIKEANITPPIATENLKTIIPKNMKDAGVSTNTEEYLLNKFDQWKTEEHAKYNKEINELRTQIFETINSIKEKQDVSKDDSKDSKIVEQLQSAIKEQEVEIMKLKQDLANSENRKHREDAEKNKETEVQISFWSKRAEAQSKQYDALLQKLNDVAKDAKESRALAEMEKERATQLQMLLQKSLSKRAETVTTSMDDLVVENHVKNEKANHMKSLENKKSNNNIMQMTDRHTLENLHKKAQELLNLGSVNSTSSDSSSSPMEEIRPISKKDKSVANSPLSVSNLKTLKKSEFPKPIQRNHVSVHMKTDTDKVLKDKVGKTKTDKNKHTTKALIQSTPVKSGSPMRVVRAKLTEEVNNRLVSVGVDPLKRRLPQIVFQKQRMELQQLHESKIKKNPNYEKVRHSILAFLDSSTSNPHKEVNGIHEYVSPNKVNKHFRSLTSVISNVKSKALSLVKLNENHKEKRRSTLNVAKKAMSFVNTPPSSVPESPVVRSSNEKSTHNHNKSDKAHKLKTNQIYENKTERESINIYRTLGPTKDVKMNGCNLESEEESIESDHKYYNTTSVVSDTAKSIENLIKSPARRPASADNNLNISVRKYAVENSDLFTRTQSTTNLSEIKVEHNKDASKVENTKNYNSSDDVESLSDTPIKKALSDENIQIVKQTKGVLKNASSVSSLNKKKVLFDMDAIQMKSVSASPSQSITEKSDGNEKYELGLVNLDGEEWDISSIENEPLKNDTKIHINTRTSPKIAELKQTIESQLARRNDTPSTAIVGGVDILAGPIPRVPSIGGSNTSLGSSILDDSDGIPPVSHKAFVKPRKVTEKDDSELDISEFSVEGLANKNDYF